MKKLSTMFAAAAIAAAPAFAQDAQEPALDVPVAVTHVVTTGYWEEQPEAEEAATPAGEEGEAADAADGAAQEPEAGAPAEAGEAPAAEEAGEAAGETAAADEEAVPAEDAAPAEAAGETAARSGTYRVIAMRDADADFGSRLFVQRLSEGEIVDTVEIEELGEAPANVTDIRPGESFGAEGGTGLTVFVFLQGSPDAVELDTWELFIDEFGDLAFGPATN